MSSANLYASLRGKGLVAFSDPSAAKSCLALACILGETNREVELTLVSNKSYTFYRDWDAEIRLCDIVPDLASGEYDWIFTGTSHPDSSAFFELHVIQKAVELKIPVFAFVDHASNLLLRFTEEEKITLPDQVLLTGEEEKKAAIASGIPEDKIRLIENPYHTFLRDYWKSNLSKATFRERYSIPDSMEKILVYAPDPLTLREETSKGSFTEFTVMEELQAYLENHPNIFLVVKVHPLQPDPEKFKSFAKAENIYIDSENKVDNLEAIHHADAVLGFYSNFLLEAAKMDKRVYRYFPANDVKDWLEHSQTGQKITTLEVLDF